MGGGRGAVQGDEFLQVFLQVGLVDPLGGLGPELGPELGVATQQPITLVTSEKDGVQRPAVLGCSSRFNLMAGVLYSLINKT